MIEYAHAVSPRLTTDSSCASARSPKITQAGVLSSCQPRTVIKGMGSERKASCCRYCSFKYSSWQLAACSFMAVPAAQQGGGRQREAAAGHACGHGHGL